MCSRHVLAKTSRRIGRTSIEEGREEQRDDDDDVSDDTVEEDRKAGGFRCRICVKGAESGLDRRCRTRDSPNPTKGQSGEERELNLAHRCHHALTDATIGGTTGKGEGENEDAHF